MDQRPDLNINIGGSGNIGPALIFSGSLMITTAFVLGAVFETSPHSVALSIFGVILILSGFGQASGGTK
jgi:hypothetical protein